MLELCQEKGQSPNAYFLLEITLFQQTPAVSFRLEQLLGILCVCVCMWGFFYDFDIFMEDCFTF